MALRWRGWRGRLGIAVALGTACGLAQLAPSAQWATRLGIDGLLVLRHHAFGPLFPAERSAVAVVVIDEETYRTPPFADLPRVVWTPQIGKVIEAVVGGGAAVVGLDMVFPTTLDRPGLMLGYDRPFLLALRDAGRAGKLVLGQIQLSAETIAPHRGQVAAAGGAQNLRLLNVLFDADDVVRRYPARHRDDQGGQTSFAVELAARAGTPPPDADFLVNFSTGPADLPAFSFADLWACIEKGDKSFFRRHFEGRIVLIGTALDVEDRHLNARRLVAAGWAPDPQRRCALPMPPAQRSVDVERRSEPGVFVHAAAVNTLRLELPLRPLHPWTEAAAVGLIAFLGTLLFFALHPLAGAAAGSAALAVGTAAALLLFRAGIVAPLLGGALALSAAYLVATAYRVVVEGAEKRRLKHAFRHYLAPSLVERIADDPDALKLGGEAKRVTVFFSDIAGFTALSERLAAEPERLVGVLNAYMSVMSEAIERNLGYVDKYIGDAIMAVWGAPLPDPDQERHAAQAALDCLAALDRFNAEVVAQHGVKPIGTRIGINTGTAIAGNMGWYRRLNYTVIGDMVNLSARLEGANKEYGSRIMLGEATARPLRGGFVLRPLDRLIVKGKSRPERTFELLGRAGEMPQEALDRLAMFRGALARYYRRDFAGAADRFGALASADAAAAMYVARCEAYRAAPPPSTWDGSFALKTK